MANAEDNVSGRFWDGRFKSQALLDEAALIAAMAYVDLNPIRAGMAETPEESDYTAIQQRILEQDPEIANQKPDALEKLPEDLKTAIGKLMPFSDQTNVDQVPDDSERTIPYEIEDYLELVDWSGRAVVEGKHGSIPENLPPIRERLKIDPAAYIKFINRSEKTRFGNFIGPVEAMRDLASALENPSSAHLVHHWVVARGRQVLWPGPFATERTGSVLACTVRMRERAKRPGRGAWRDRSRRRDEYKVGSETGLLRRNSSAPAEANPT